MARIANFLFGGTTNWAVDREFARRALSSLPRLREVTEANRRFVIRAVRYLARIGVRQFIDVGGGVPTLRNTHQVADEVEPDCRVVYVEEDPVSFAHAELLLDQDGDPDRHAVVHAELSDPETLWERACDTLLIDPDEPVAFLIASAQHTVQAGPCGSHTGEEIVGRCRELLPTGSYLAISNLAKDDVPDEMADQLRKLRELFSRACRRQLIWRSEAEITALFGDFELVEPGVVWTPNWRPDTSDPFDTPNQSVMRAGVGRKVH